MKQARIVFVVGSTGAGKTTHARALARTRGALVFSIDEWMQTLFAVDLSPHADFQRIAERTQRVRRQMWSLADQALALGTDVIFDAGLLTRADRADSLRRAEERGVAAEIHYLAPPAETRWARVATRNAARGDAYAFEVTRPMFDFIETIWQAPDADEMAGRPFVTIECDDAIAAPAAPA